MHAAHALLCSILCICSIINHHHHHLFSHNHHQLDIHTGIHLSQLIFRRPSDLHIAVNDTRYIRVAPLLLLLLLSSQLKTLHAHRTLSQIPTIHTLLQTHTIHPFRQTATPNTTPSHTPIDDTHIQHPTHTHTQHTPRWWQQTVPYSPKGASSQVVSVRETVTEQNNGETRTTIRKRQSNSVLQPLQRNWPGWQTHRN